MKLAEAKSLNINKATTAELEEAMKTLGRSVRASARRLQKLGYDEDIQSPALQALEKRYTGAIRYNFPNKKKFMETYTGKNAGVAWRNLLKSQVAFGQHWTQLKTSTVTGTREWKDNMERSIEAKFGGQKFTDTQKHTMWRALNRLRESDATKQKMMAKGIDSDVIYKVMQLSYTEGSQLAARGWDIYDLPTTEDFLKDLPSVPLDEQAQAVEDYKTARLAQALSESKGSHKSMFERLDKAIDELDSLEQFTSPLDIFS